MKAEWELDLRRLEWVQEDLRSRLEALDEQIGDLRSRWAAAKVQPLPDAPRPFLPSLEMAQQVSVLECPVRAQTEDLSYPQPSALTEEAPPIAVQPALGSGGAEPPALPASTASSVPPTQPVDPAPPEENLELRVGQYWLVRIGILVLLTGLVLLGNLAYQNVITKLGAPGKLALMYLAGGGLTAVGVWLNRRMEPVRNYARVLVAGGVATIYYTTYAAHFVAPLRVIESPLVAGMGLLLLAGGLAWFAERRKSEGVAFTAILLTYYTSAINPATHFTLFSNVVLTGVAVFLLARHRWFVVSWLGLAGCYGSFAYWRWQAGGAGDGDFWVTHGFLAAYWVIFTVAVFLHRGETFRTPHREAFLSANNAAFFALTAPAFHARYPEQFWLLAVLFGIILLGLAGVARRMRREDLSFDGTYLGQGLVVLTIGLIARFSGYQLAIILGVQSMGLLFLSQFRHRQLLQIASGLTSLGALDQALKAFSPAGERTWLVGAVVTGLLLGNAAMFKHVRGNLGKPQWTWGSAGYGWGGLVLLGVTLANQYQGTTLLWVALAVAILGTVTLPLHRLPEIAVGVQAFLVAAWVSLGPAFLHESLDWYNTLPVLAAALLLMHWWQRQALFSPAVGRVIEAVDALVFCGALGLWIAQASSLDLKMLTLAAVGLAVLIYGFATRAWFLAILSQSFTIGGTTLCFLALLGGNSPWPLTLGTILMIALQAAAGWWIAKGGPSGLRAIIPGYRAVVLLLFTAWLMDVLPASAWFLSFTVVGLLMFLPAATRKSREFLLYAAFLTGLGVCCHLLAIVDGSAASGSDFLALLFLLGLQQAGKKRLGGTGWFPAAAQGGLAVASLTGLWYHSSRWAAESPGGMAVTVVWALLAFAALGAGFLLRERAYRLMGLFILAVAVGHVFFVDVWKMGQLAGILGILALAIVLLVLGFIYNRFAGQINKWL